MDVAGAREEAIRQARAFLETEGWRDLTFVGAEWDDDPQSGKAFYVHFRGFPPGEPSFVHALGGVDCIYFVPDFTQIGDEARDVLAHSPMLAMRMREWVRRILSRKRRRGSTRLPQLAGAVTHVSGSKVTVAFDDSSEGVIEAPDVIQVDVGMRVTVVDTGDGKPIVVWGS